MGRRREMRIGILQTGRADIAAVKFYVRFAPTSRRLRAWFSKPSKRGCGERILTSDLQV
jgi:hypothetical protein